MDRERYALILIDRLGPDGYSALSEMHDDSQNRMLGEMNHRFDLAEERLERRLAEACGQLRADMHDGFGQLRADMANQRADLMKWALLFWVTQAAAVAGIVTALR